MGSCRSIVQGNTSFKHSSSSSSRVRLFSINIFPPQASHLLNGLQVYQVIADDGHALTVYGIEDSPSVSSSSTMDSFSRPPILLLHGRTWSSVPVYHLLGGDNKIRYKQPHSRSLMEMLYMAGLQPFAMDFRGFGGTRSDSSGVVVPNRCVKDVECVLEFLTRHRGKSGEDQDKSGENSVSIPSLLGWSQGWFSIFLYTNGYSRCQPIHHIYSSSIFISRCLDCAINSSKVTPSHV